MWEDLFLKRYFLEVLRRNHSFEKWLESQVVNALTKKFLLYKKEKNISLKDIKLYKESICKTLISALALNVDLMKFLFLSRNLYIKSNRYISKSACPENWIFRRLRIFLCFHENSNVRFKFNSKYILSNLFKSNFSYP